MAILILNFPVRVKEEKENEEEEKAEGIHPIVYEYGVHPTAQLACSHILTALPCRQIRFPLVMLLYFSLSHFKKSVLLFQLVH
uniref:Uncharacterized protein n=1 Tax=Lepeophtheirus salmonis TaxID=72036 RepID=A0A0K2T8M1_LEPSM